ncbi:hypothetical protein [Halomonas denitrificans]|uniref:hypothetical protein n=1 Tax=Halomonas denitrificans TaxID=370769 RepID=UPI000D331B5F|nr:hypothetical protein [Halomonas denitrificans]
MLLSSDALAARLSGAGLLVLYPGYLFYHTLVALGLIPAFLGGMFGLMTVLLAALYLPLLPYLQRDLLSLVPGYALGVIGLLGFVLVWSGAGYLVEGGTAMRVAAIQSVETVVLWLVLFLLAYRLPLEARWLVGGMWLAFAITVIYLAVFAATTGQVMFVARGLGESTEEVSTYQGYARSALVMLVFLIAVSRSALARAAVIGLGSFVMFLLGARSELYGFLLLAMGLLMLWSGMSARYLLILLAVLGLGVATVVSQFEAIAESRQFQVLDLAGDSSWQARQQLERAAVEQLLAHPLIGEFAGHVSASGGSGGYAHNVLSAWVNYGLPGFVLYLGLTLTALAGATYRMVLCRDLSACWVFAFALNAVCLLLMLIAKPVFWPLPALGWGSFANALVRSRRPLDHDDAHVPAGCDETSQGRDNHESGTPDLRPSAP